MYICYPIFAFVLLIPIQFVTVPLGGIFGDVSHMFFVIFTVTNDVVEKSPLPNVFFIFFITKPLECRYKMRHRRSLFCRGRHPYEKLRNAVLFVMLFLQQRRACIWVKRSSKTASRGGSKGCRRQSGRRFRAPAALYRSYPRRRRIRTGG